MADFAPAAIKPSIGIAALEALDIRVGTIERVDEIPRSDKLTKLTVNFGDHSRTIVAGVKKERSNPREIEGRQALFVVNLEPRKMAGETSEGMLFDIGYADGIRSVLAGPDRPVTNGPRAGYTIYLAAASFCAAQLISATYYSSTRTTTTNASSACLHCFSSNASRTAG